MFRTQFNQFNLDAPDVPSTPSIASLMATQGVSTSEGFAADLPPVNIEPTATAPAEAAPVLDAPSATPATDATATPEVPPATEEPTVAVPAPIDAPAAEVPTWQEVLRKQQPHDVLKELGYDDNTVDFLRELKGVDPKMVAFFQYWKENNGDVSAYVKELSTDYKAMSAEDVMRHQLQREFPEANERTLNLLFQKRVREYNLDSDDPEEAEDGRLLLEAETQKVRRELIAEQEKKLFPKPPQKTEPSVDPALAAAEQTFGAYKQKVDASPAAQSLLKNGKLELGDYGFHYPLPNAEGIVKNLTDVLQTYIAVGKMTPENIGQFSEAFIQDQLLIGAFSQNPKAFLKEFSQHLKSLGEKEVINTIDNVKTPDNSLPAPSETQPRTAAEAMAKSGVIVR